MVEFMANAQEGILEGNALQLPLDVDWLNGILQELLEKHALQLPPNVVDGFLQELLEENALQLPNADGSSMLMVPPFENEEEMKIFEGDIKITFLRYVLKTEMEKQKALVANLSATALEKVKTEDEKAILRSILIFLVACLVLPYLMALHDNTASN